MQRDVTGALMTVGNTVTDNLFTSNIYEVKISITKKRSEVSPCQDYEESNGYKDCLDKTVTKKFIDILGCLPPWMSILDENKA